MNIIGKKYWYFIVSGILIIPGLISLVIYGLFLSIDFTGGSRFDISVEQGQKITQNDVNSILEKNGIKNGIIKLNNPTNVFIRTSPIDQKTNSNIVNDFKSKYKGVKENNFDTVGPIIGKETESNALKAIIIASIAITLYIAFAFREVSRPVSSWKFGVVAIVALLHDLLIVVGVFSILGHFWHVEVDALFITALLTIMGFSVHDTIVVFDRIRENLKKSLNTPFEEVVNNSILETFNRSLNTSLTVLVVLFILLLFSGASITWFVAALLIGILVGTYSSIFNASPLLVVWYEWDKKKAKKS